METVKGVAIIAYKKERNPRFVVLKRKKNWEGWETPKGHLEDDDYSKTVFLELEEEAGIPEEKVEEVEEIDHVVRWKLEDGDQEVEREYQGFLVKVSEDAQVEVSGNPDEEHEEGYFFRYEDAKSILTYEDNVELLEKAKQVKDS